MVIVAVFLSKILLVFRANYFLRSCLLMRVNWADFKQINY